jgi:hypothetical protein
MAERTNADRGLVDAWTANLGGPRTAALQARGVARAIAFRRKKGQKDLPPMLRRLNRSIARLRAVVEHPFAWVRAMSIGGCATAADAATNWTSPRTWSRTTGIRA